MLKTTSAARMTIALDASQIYSARAVQEHRWNTYPIGTYRVTSPLLGYVARAYGPYAPGGNPVLQGPRRATPAEAEADAANPSSILWHVVGYSI